MKSAVKLSIAALAFAITGCSTYSLEELRNATPTGSPFQTALAKHYMEYSAEAEHDYDWPNSWHFADKGLVVVYGNDAGPEELSDWNIPEDKLPELQASREQLLEALTPQKEASDPKDAADAQFYFDCWVKEQDQNWRQDHIAYCREEFRSAMVALGGAPASLPLKNPSATKPKEKHATKPAVHEKKAEELKPIKKDEVAKEEAPAPVELKEEKQEPLPSSKWRGKTEVEAYIVFFQGTDTGLTESGKQVIDEVIGQVSHMDNYEVVLHGHTDTKGNQEDDLKLSEARAQAVKQRLVDGGIKADNIKVFAFGKSDTPVKTADNVAEPANHRVEIFLNDGH